MERDGVFGMVNVPGTFVDPPFGGGHLTGHVSINAVGLRGPTLDDTRRRPRVVCLGDSSTFGVQLVAGVSGDPQSRYASDNAYAERLAALVDAEVLNAGVIGYNSGHGLRQLRGFVLPRLHPDVVVVRFGFNDHAFLDPATAVRDPPWPLDAGLYLGVDLEITRALAAAYRRQLLPPAVSLERFGSNVRRMATAARAAGARIVFVDYPLRPLVPGEQLDPGMAYMGLPPLPTLYATHARYQAVLAEAAAALAAPLVTTADAITFGSVDRVHPAPAGADVIATRVAALLRE